MELDNAEGKNDGTVRGRTSITSEMVFSTLLAGEGNALLPVRSWSRHLCRCQGCRQSRSQLSAQGARTQIKSSSKGEKKQDQLICQANQNGFLQVVHHGKVDVSHVQAKFHSAMAVIAERTEVLFYKLKAKKGHKTEIHKQTH